MECLYPKIFSLLFDLRSTCPLADPFVLFPLVDGAALPGGLPTSFCFLFFRFIPPGDNGVALCVGSSGLAVPSDVAARPLFFSFSAPTCVCCLLLNRGSRETFFAPSPSAPSPASRIVPGPLPRYPEAPRPSPPTYSFQHLKAFCVSHLRFLVRID